MKAKKLDYTLPYKKRYYAQHVEDADMCCRAREEIAANTAISRMKSLIALHKVKKEVAAATKNNTVSELYERWGKEIQGG